MRGLLSLACVAAVMGVGRGDDKAAKEAAKGTAVKIAGMTGTAPAAWKEEEPSNNMRLTQFKLPKADGDADDAELALFAFAGGSGSLKQNLERQLNKFTDDGRKEKSDKVKVGTVEATFQDVSGTFKKRKTPMAAEFTEVKDYRQLYIVFQGSDEKQYYMTLLGPKATVEKHEKAFGEFLKSFK